MGWGGFCHGVLVVLRGVGCYAPQQGSTTGLGLLHNMRNDYRSGRKVLHVVVEVELHDRVKALAAWNGCSITEFVTKVLEKGTGNDVGVGSADSVLSGAKGGVVGSHCAGDSGGSVVGGPVGRGVDWDSILVAGKKPVVAARLVDPIEEIA